MRRSRICVTDGAVSVSGAGAEPVHPRSPDERSDIRRSDPHVALLMRATRTQRSSKSNRGNCLSTAGSV